MLSPIRPISQTLVTGSGFAVIRMIKPFDKGTKSTQADKLRREKIPIPPSTFSLFPRSDAAAHRGLVWAITKSLRGKETDGGTGNRDLGTGDSERDRARNKGDISTNVAGIEDAASVTASRLSMKRQPPGAQKVERYRGFQT